MKKYIFVAIGGSLGAMLRFQMKFLPLWGGQTNFPTNTLLVNLSGSFLLAVFLTMANELISVDPSIRAGIATGFLGAYTTFSTLCKETVNFLFQGKPFLAAVYMVLSTLLGLALVYQGNGLARTAFAGLFGKGGCIGKKKCGEE